MKPAEDKPINLIESPHQAMKKRLARRARVWRILLFALAAGILAAGYHFWGGLHSSARPQYHMVLLTNGQMYIGKLEDLGSAFSVMTDVFYFQNQVDPLTKETKSVLVKRRNEFHAPDRLMLNSRQIVSIEPVGPNSVLAQRLVEAKELP
jgi:hypothetical protein